MNFPHGSNGPAPGPRPEAAANPPPVRGSATTRLTRLGSLPDGTAIFEIDQHLSQEQYAQLRDSLQRNLEAEALAIVLPPGVRLATNPAQLDRIEQKLDALIKALAAEGEEEQGAQGTSLDGEPLACERDQSQSLG